ATSIDQNKPGRIPSDSISPGTRMRTRSNVMRSRWGVGSCGIVVVVLVGLLTAGSGARADVAEDAAALAATIDRLIAARWDADQRPPPPPADDAEFLRRVTLDLTGKIPTAGEVREFLDDPRGDKRGRLVERLLGGPAYIAHLTNLERRLLIPEADSTQQVRVL